MYAIKKNNPTSIWENSLIDDTGSYSSLKYLDIGVDSRGIVSIVYYDEKMNYLKYARFPESGVVNPDNVTKEIIDINAMYTNILSLDIDKYNNVHVSYRGVNGLRYAVRVRDQWHVFEIKDVTYASSIVVDDLGRINIAYGMSDLHFIRPGKLMPVIYELEK